MKTETKLDASMASAASATEIDSMIRDITECRETWKNKFGIKYCMEIRTTRRNNFDGWW
jgi:hypothetical protein